MEPKEKTIHYLYQDLLRKSRSELGELNLQIKSCRSCLPSGTPVIGEGHPLAELMIVNGEPEGTANTILAKAEKDAIIKSLSALDIDFQAVYFTCAVKCVGCGNNEKNLVNCRTHLFREIEIILPKVIVAMGMGAVGALVPSAPTAPPKTDLPGQILSFRTGMKVIATESISDALRDVDIKVSFWNSFKKIKGFEKVLGIA